MKKIIPLIFIFLSLFTFLATPVFADEISDGENGALDDYSETVTSELNEAVDDDTKKTLEENGIDSSDISGVTLFDVISAVVNEFLSALTSPIRILAQLAAIIIILSAVRSISLGGTERAFAMISVLGSVTVIYQSVYSAFENLCKFLDTLCTFMTAYIPIYASVTAASGNYTAGGSYYAAAFGVCELAAFVSNKVVMPFLSVFLAVSFTAAINPDMKFSSAAESLKNTVSLILTALMTIFTGLTSIQGLSGSAADSAASRAVKFSASNFIPIIGGSVSEAYSAVYSGLGVIRSSVGTVGIIAAAAMVLAPLMQILAVRFVASAAGFISDLLGVREISELMKSVGFALSAAASTMLCFCMMFIMSTAVIMLVAARL
jgi:stage III sporulation protein AE